MKKYFIIKDLKTKGYVILNEVTRNGEFVTYTPTNFHTKEEAQRFPYVSEKEAYSFAKKYIWGKIKIELVET